MAEPLLEIGASNISCALSAAGASVAGVRVRGRRGRFTEVALSPSSLRTGADDPSLAGRTVGPCCGRIRGGEAVIDGTPARLTQNEGPNHLHGGLHGCASSRWEVVERAPDCARFRLTLADGLDGYPGNRVLWAEYAATADELRVTYEAVTDRTTFLDMTSHVYWDLSGRFDGGATRQSLQIAATRVVYNDAAHLPQEIKPADEALDFSKPCALSEKMARFSDHPQITVARGFNNAYVIDPALRRAFGFAARLCAPDGGFSLTLDTDQPAVVLYSGGFLGPETALQTPPGAASPGCALALEAQGLPDPFHLPGAAASCLRPGETYRRVIRWRFGI